MAVLNWKTHTKLTDENHLGIRMKKIGYCTHRLLWVSRCSTQEGHHEDRTLVVGQRNEGSLSAECLMLPMCLFLPF